MRPELALSWRRVHWLLLLTILFSAVPAVADEEDDEDDDTVQRVMLWFENDLIVKSGDRYYTNGAKIAYQSSTVSRVSSFVSAGMSHALSGWPTAWGISLGQNIYTPRDVKEPRLIPDDRPYTGWLYVGLSLTRVNAELAELVARSRRGPQGMDREAWDREMVELAGETGLLFQELIELDVGVFGRDAAGSRFQIEVHRQTGSGDVAGWRNQLKSEPAVELLYQRKYLLPIMERGLQIHFLPHLGFAAGTIDTHGAIGGTVRIGLNMGYQFGPPQPIGSGLDALAPTITELIGPGQKRNIGIPGIRSLYVYGRIEGRAVAYNAAIDGSLFRSRPKRLSTRGIVERHDVEAERLVGVAEGGVGIDLTFGLSLSVSAVTRTIEFRGQRKAFNFGALHLAWTF